MKKINEWINYWKKKKNHPAMIFDTNIIIEHIAWEKSKLIPGY
mgnify:CR=1 FL=1